jgi:SH3 domain protein
MEIVRASTTMRALASLAATLLLAVAAAPARAEQAWVRGEVRLNVRTGPGTQYRILGVVSTGNEVKVLDRTDDWTRVEITEENGDVKQGWIPEGYLRADPPPTIRLSQAESRVGNLEQELADLRAETEKLRSDNETLTAQDGDQQSKIKQLTMENMELRAGARYPEWITGASIFAAGMVLGAWLHRNSARRQPTRIRL